MKIYFVLVLIWGMASCSNQKVSKAKVTGTSNYVLTLGQKQEMGKLRVTLKEVQENRCPVNMNCLRIGEAIAVLNVVVDNKTERNIQLCTGSDCRSRALYESYNFVTDDQKYLFRLDSITPDPTKTVVQADKKVYFSVSEIK
ncbi:MAG TPA: hypothetical protein PK191_07610 [Niabella sp.]|nr:hypothetical protein [Niabella sp.]HOZ97622.1 hypothetical protein [Niabella sp.]HQW15760.1 hypothetical protein [Niabella sp.]HQX21035.1 hypothetical protein [Niabella sp.]HQX41868.1 hypothetical protein [Niabella sp.]